MSNQEKKEALRQYLIAEQEEARLAEEIERWRSRAEQTTAGYSLAPSDGGDGRTLENTVAHIADLTRQLTAQRDRLVSLRQTLGGAIDAVPDARLRELLRLRYIEGLAWVNIAVKMGYEDIRWVYRLHGRALEQLTIESHY